MFFLSATNVIACFQTYTLSNLKGMIAFKKFLLGSTGEKNWLLWMDIERAKLLDNKDDLLR